jgi:hypothetical protein
LLFYQLTMRQFFGSTQMHWCALSSFLLVRSTREMFT